MCVEIWQPLETGTQNRIVKTWDANNLELTHQLFPIQGRITQASWCSLALSEVKGIAISGLKYYKLGKEVILNVIAFHISLLNNFLSISSYKTFLLRYNLHSVKYANLKYTP